LQLREARARRARDLTGGVLTLIGQPRTQLAGQRRQSLHALAQGLVDLLLGLAGELARRARLGPLHGFRLPMRSGRLLLPEPLRRLRGGAELRPCALRRGLHPGIGRRGRVRRHAAGRLGMRVRRLARARL
jgi:hypothetical protein